MTFQQLKKNARLRELMAQPGLLVAPGCRDRVVARSIQKLGFQVCNMGSNGITMGLAEQGLFMPHPQYQDLVGYSWEMDLRQLLKQGEWGGTGHIP